MKWKSYHKWCCNLFLLFYLWALASQIPPKESSSSLFSFLSFQIRYGISSIYRFDVCQYPEFNPYLSGLFGMNVIKRQRDFTGISCSSIVRKNFQLYFVWHIDQNVSNTSRIGANLSALGLVLCLFGLTSNLKYLKIFRNLYRGIVFEKNRNSIFFVVEKPYVMIFFQIDLYRTEGQWNLPIHLESGKSWYLLFCEPVQSRISQ